MASLKKIGVHQNVSYRMVDPKDLTLNPENERDYIGTDDRMVRLRQSLASEGVKTPLHIYDDGMVDDGNRRLYNIGLLIEAGEWKHGDVPAILVPRPANVIEAVLTRLNKNEAAQFSALEQGRAFAKLRAEGMNNSQIAARSPFTSMHIGNMLSLHDAGEEVREAVLSGRMSATLAVETLRKHGETVVLEAIALAEQQGKDKATQRHIDAVTAAPEPIVTPAPAETAPVAVEAPVEVEVTTPAMVEVDASAPVEVEVTAPVVVEAGSVEVDAQDPPFDVTPDASAPTASVVATEVEVVPTTPTPEAPTRGNLTPKTLLAIIAPTLARLAEALASGTKAEKLEALAESEDDIASFVANAKTMGILED